MHEREDVEHEQECIQQQVTDQRAEHHAAGVIGNDFACADIPLHNPRLTTDFRYIPPCETRNPACKSHPAKGAQQPRADLIAKQCVTSPPSDCEHEKAHADHYAEAPEKRGHRWMRVFEFV